MAMVMGGSGSGSGDVVRFLPTMHILVYNK